MDERNKQDAYRIISIMYFLTIFAMQAIVIYRQFALGQELHEFEDLAILMTVNSLFLISALLYFGAIPIRRLKIKSILLIYLLLVTLGSLFTYAKYNLFGSAKLSFSQLFDKLIAVYAITGIIMLFLILFSILGNQRWRRSWNKIITLQIIYILHPMKALRHKILWMVVILTTINLNSQGQANTNERALWFTDARFGMFIHWGVYSGAEGIWKGEKLRNDNDYAEWIYYRNRIAREEYTTLLDRFDWEHIDPEQWVLLAKKAGMKYVTITAKHHDGFALWDSQVSDYDVAEFTNPKRDIIKELSEACAKHGLKLGLYYSHWVDWEHPDGWDHSKEIYGITAEDYDRYWQGKVIPQMRELLTNYGEIGIMWFDMWIHHSRTCVTKEQLLQLKDVIRELQPNCLVNSRLGLSIEEDSDIDFKTLGDNQLGSKKEEFPWQSPATVAHSWGFHALEKQWKSSTTLLQSLIGNVSLNGNMMLNIGPRANGDVPYEIEQRLLAMGNWLSVNGESIYGSQAFDLVKDQHDWGKITCKQNTDGSTMLYLHVYNWPLSHKLPVTGIRGKPVKAYLLASPETTLSFSGKGVVTELDLPAEAPDLLVSVVVLEYASYPTIEDGLVAQSVYGGFSFTPKNALKSEGNMQIQAPGRRGTVPAHIRVTEKSSYQWRIYMDKAMTLYCDISYAFEGKGDSGKITVKSESAKLSDTFQNTGRFVGEPNSNWQIESFNAHRLGQLEFSEPGYYDITLEFKPGKDGELSFQWLWLGTE